MSEGAESRRLAIEVLTRIDRDGAYANLALPAALGRSRLDERDRAFATDLVYGATRMRRALDAVLDPHLRRRLEPRVRAALRAGAYQLGWQRVPPHAAVDATVEAAPKRARGLVNAVLRRVAEDLDGGAGSYPFASEAERLSMPDWILEELRGVLGREGAVAAVEAMNAPATVHERDDGYVQDPASQAVADLVPAAPGDRAVDLCAAPGGKATGLARRLPTVAVDIHPGRLGLVAANAERLGVHLPAVAADATTPPFRRRRSGHVLLDAPCSGLGVLRRRPDARWRIQPRAPQRLAALQRRMWEAAVALVGPGAVAVYSVCTLTLAETTGVIARCPEGFEPVPVEGDGWHVLGAGAFLAPSADHDGMFAARFRRWP